jgi:uncharacterized protein (TIGR02453 family)
VHIAPDEVFFGGGIWMPPPPELLKIREAIRKDGLGWRTAVEGQSFRKRFGGVGGDALSRPPRGFDASEPNIDDIKRKSFFAMQQGSEKQTLSSRFADEVADAMTEASPLIRFLCGALGVPS